MFELQSRKICDSEDLFFKAYNNENTICDVF